jgi:hypothetical protein
MGGLLRDDPTLGGAFVIFAGGPCPGDEKPDAKGEKH